MGETQQAKLAVQPEPSDEAIEDIKRRRFQERVNRVLAVMRQERIDWRGLPVLTPDGRITVQVVPVEMSQP